LEYFRTRVPAECLLGAGTVTDVELAEAALGAGASFIVTPNIGAEHGFCPCHSVPEIDPVGAGDAFCAGVLSGLLDGKPLREAVDRGAALGAFCVSTFGDYQGLPDRIGLKAFMEGSSIPGR